MMYVGKTGRFSMKLVEALEVELLCTVVSDTGTGTITPPQAPLPQIFLGS
jgi:hypothetical protein